jgi:tetratricopeptide (TPR) repeat protein
MTKPTRQRMLVWSGIALVFIVYHFLFRPPNKIVGPSRWDLLTSDGLKLLENGNLHESEVKLLDALHEAERTPEIRLRRPTSLHNLGDLRMKQHRYAEACALYREALDGLDAIPTAPIMQRALVANNLAVALVDNRHADQAEPFFQRAIGLSKHASESGAHNSAEFMRHFAGYLLVLGRTSESLNWMMQANEIDHPATTRASSQPS